jgi:type I restriction enzyme, S subunit
MKKWELVKSSRIVTYKTGKLDSNAAEDNGKYPFFTCAETTYQINKYAFDTECVLLAGNNATGVFPLKYYKGKFNAYQRTYIIEPVDRESLNIKYFYYYLRPLLKSFEQSATGATTKFLTLKILNNLHIALPSFSEQKKIAAILSAYDDLIENNKRRIALLEKMAEEIYREWFVRMRFPGHEQVAFHKGIPEGWEVVNCEQLLNTKSGKKVDLVPDGRFRVYGSNGLIGLSNQSNAENVIVIGRVGAYCGSIEFDVDRVWATDNTIIAKANPERTNNYFCFFLLKQLNLGNLAGGSAQPLLTQELIRKLRILAAPTDVYRQFEQIVKPMFCQIDLFNVTNQNLQQTRDRLLPRLISGKLAVEDLDIQFPPSMSAAEAVTHER